MRAKHKRSAAMRRVIARLEKMERSLAWLGGKLSPHVTRQTVSGWHDVPDHHVRQVAALLSLPPADVRPDLAALFDSPPLERVA